MFAQTQKNDTIRKDTTTTIPEKKIIKHTLKGIVTGETDDETLPGAHIYVGEDKKPGYGLYDRALGCAYITGLFEAYEDKENK